MTWYALCAIRPRDLPFEGMVYSSWKPGNGSRPGLPGGDGFSEAPQAGAHSRAAPWVGFVHDHWGDYQGDGGSLWTFSMHDFQEALWEIGGS